MDKKVSGHPHIEAESGPLRRASMDRKEYNSRMDQLCDETGSGGKAFEVAIVEAPLLTKMMDAADEGDELAIRVCSAFEDWCKTAIANKPGHGCFDCGEIIKKGSVAVIVAVLPLNRKGIGLVTCMCGDCRKRTQDPKECMQKVRKSLEMLVPGLNVNTLQ
jgi:hypothetical protein